MLRQANIIRLVCSFLFLAFLCSCVNNQPSSSPSIKPEGSILTAEQVINDIYTKEELKDLNEYIENINYRPATSSDMASYFQSPEECSALYEIGLKGIPALIYNTSNISFPSPTPPELGCKATYQMFGAVSLLHCHDIDVPFIQDGRRCDENFYSFYSDSKQICPTIIASNKTANEKAEDLKHYGLLALPHILGDKKSVFGDADKNSLFEIYSKKIGLHLTTQEFMKIVSDDGFSFHERYVQIENHPKAEDFDYKVWLSENEEDLDDLFKFLDAYCAEYEAEIAEE